MKIGYWSRSTLLGGLRRKIFLHVVGAQSFLEYAPYFVGFCKVISVFYSYIYLFFYLFIYLFFCLFIYLFVCLFVNLWNCHFYCCKCSFSLSTTRLFFAGEILLRYRPVCVRCG